MEEVECHEDEIEDNECFVGASSKEEVVVKQMKPGSTEHWEEEPVDSELPIELFMVLLQLK